MYQTLGKYTFKTLWLGKGHNLSGLGGLDRGQIFFENDLAGNYGVKLFPHEIYWR